VVGRIFIVLCIIQDVVSVHGPLAVDPHMYRLIHDAILRKLVIHVVLAWQFECSVAAIHWFFDVLLLMVVIVSSPECSNVLLY
jgi:hypothetical protein